MSARRDRLPMDSESARRRIQLYLYDELGVQERLEIERACAEDPRFRALFEDEKEFLAELDRCEPEADSEELLAQCRRDLMQAVRLTKTDGGGAPAAPAPGGWRRRLTAGPGLRRFAWRPALAAACLAVGFLFGRSDVLQPRSVEQAALADSPAGPAEIQSVRVGPEPGRVQIVLEERKIVSGAANDPAIRRLLLDSVRAAHSGARLASLEALGGEAGHGEVRRELLRLMLEDENPGVRLKALDAVRLRSGEPEIQQALVQAVLRDPNPGMRVQAIQLLTANPSRGLAGAFQHIMEQEQNLFVQQQCEKALQDLGASVEYH